LKSLLSFPDDRTPLSRSVKNRSRPRRPGQSESGQHQRFPRHGQRRSRRQHLLHGRTLRRLQVRHPRPEDRHQLQGLHAQIHLRLLEDQHRLSDAGADLDAGTVPRLDRRGLRPVRGPGHLRPGSGGRQGRQGIYNRGERQRSHLAGRLPGGGQAAHRRPGGGEDAGHLQTQESGQRGAGAATGRTEGDFGQLDEFDALGDAATERLRPSLALQRRQEGQSR
jgi:hypothetical protein